ncbi:MAG: hypothetical protein ACTHJL_05895 [Amnibacterium sp.]
MMQPDAGAAYDEAAEVRLKTCPGCRSGEHVEIAPSPTRSRTEWMGRCTGCDAEWSFSDL